MKRTDIEKLYGQKFNYLTLIKEVERPGRRRYVEAICECGTVKIFEWDNFRSGKSQSCGCLKFKFMEGRRHPLYKVWGGMKQRCYNHKSNAYKDYGGRGISVCERWLVYENFYEDNKDRYVEGYDLDRERNNGDYSTDNTRFVPHKINGRNTRRCKFTEKEAAEIRESTEEAATMAIKYGVHKNTIWKIRSGKRWAV